MPSKEEVIEALKSVNYPGFSKDIVTLGVVEDVDVAPDRVVVALKSVSADDETVSRFSEEVEQAVRKIVGDAEVHVVLGGGGTHGQGEQKEEPAFHRNRIPGVANIIPVTSGKGGVGKSTIAVNLAYTLAQLGHRVGVLDLDVFGPSVHKMTGARGQLQVVNNMIMPFETKGLKIISVGMAVPEDDALILRGPMVMKLLNQLMGQVNWGELDYLIVDMPPGTGDVPLSLVQQLAVTGAVVVTTPQDISLIDVRRSIAMFRQTQTHILGVVENMSHYVCEKCGDVAHIFGKGGGEAEAEKMGVPLLGKVPLVKSICDAADAGDPIFDREKSPELARVFEDLANRVICEAQAAPDPQAAAAAHPHSAPTGGGGG